MKTPASITAIYEAAKSTGHVSSKQTAKLIRHRLKSAIPDEKFVVTKKDYAGGSSVYVVWSGSTPKALVEEFVRPFQGRRFDAVLDLSVAVTSYLEPDGSATFAETLGTQHNMGEISAGRQFKPSPDAIRVNFSADIVMCIWRRS